MSHFDTLWTRFIHPVTGVFRKRRGTFMRSQFPGIESMTVCDLGGSIHFWQKVGIAIPPERLTILNNEDDCVSGGIRSDEAPAHRIALYDGVNIPFPDR